MANTQNTEPLSSLFRGVGPGGFVGVDLANEVMTGTILPAAHLPSAPSFAGAVTVSGTLGIIFDNATADATVVSANHAVARTYTIPDCGAAASFVMTELAQTINGVKTFGAQPIFKAGTTSSDGIRFDGATNDAIVVAADHAAARVYTIPDCGAAASFVMTELAQSIAGTKTFTGSVVLTSATVVTPTVADANVIGGIPVVHRIAIANGSTADTDVTLTYKTRVTDVVVIKTGGAGGASDTITVKNGTTAITNALDINVADKVVVRAGTIDDASFEIAAAGTLRVSMVNGASGGNNTACEVIVSGFRVA